MSRKIGNDHRLARDLREHSRKRWTTFIVSTVCAHGRSENNIVVAKLLDIGVVEIAASAVVDDFHAVAKAQIGDPPLEPI